MTIYFWLLKFSLSLTTESFSKFRLPQAAITNNLLAVLIDQTLETGKLLIQIASWYSQLGKLEEAEQVFSRAEKIFTSFPAEEKQQLAMASLHNNRGYMYSERGKHDEVKFNF